ncbi:MAG: polymorphic toxin type 28 domain-containing protein, partial [Anaerolineae bacterium]|nr:polymorphic toxin type 28 domain-containing protein [Anaerolineae bacterium]
EADSLKRLTGVNWLAPRGKIGPGSDSTTVDANGQFESTVFFWQSETSTLPIWKSWNLTNLTQKWAKVSGPGSFPSYGVILWATNEDVNGYDLRFYSSEAVAADQPKLEVTYSQTPRTVYFLKDHLGSVRATVQDTSTAPVCGYDDYDPWGYILAGRSVNSVCGPTSMVTRNKFTGKEWDDEHGVNWNYFGARYYDPQVGRWMARDPLAEKYPLLSPYNYSANNPVVNYDRDGRFIDTIVDVVSIAYDVYDIAKTVVKGESVSGTQVGALAADVGALFIPVVTGAGTAVRAASKVDDVVDIARAAEKSTDVAKVADNATGATKVTKADVKTPTDRIKEQLFERPGQPKSKSTLRGAQTELAGGQTEAAIKKGRAFDHVTKVRNAQRGLLNRIQQIKSQLGNRNLSAAQRESLERELSEASTLLDKSEEFVPRQ